MATFDEIEKKLREEDIKVYLIGLVSAAVAAVNVKKDGNSIMNFRNAKLATATSL